MQVTWFSMGKAGQWRKRSARRSTDVTLPARHITGSVSVSHRYTPISCVAQTKHSYLTPSRCSDSLNFHLFSSAQTLARLFFFFLSFFPSTVPFIQANHFLPLPLRLLASRELPQRWSCTLRPTLHILHTHSCIKSLWTVYYLNIKVLWS